MSYSDEPNVISERSRSKKIYFLIGGLLLFMALLASVAFFPRFIEFQRRNTEVGPYDGSLYFINFEGERYSIEFARSETLDFHLGVVIQPTREGADWEPEEYHVLIRPDELEETERLEWDPDKGFFGPTELRFDPRGDVRFEVELRRGDESVWSGRKWSFRGRGGHAH